VDVDTTSPPALHGSRSPAVTQPHAATLLDEPEARRELGGIGRTKYYQLITTGELRSVRIGRRRFVPAAAIDEYVARLECVQRHTAA
jgi:excisionase family DNA binding protein